MKIAKVYYWTGITREGNRIKGQLSTKHLEAVRYHLEKRKIVGVNIAVRWRLISTHKAIKPTTIVQFSRQLAHLLAAGVSLLQALHLLAQQALHHVALQTLLTAIKEDLESGRRFYLALSQHPINFSRFYCSLIRVGEQLGKLEAMLLQIATHQETLIALKQKIHKALRYPLLLVGVASIVFMLLMLLVVPQFEQLFADAGTTLPFLTRFIIATSRNLQTYSLSLLSVIGVLALLIILFKKFLQQWVQRFVGPLWHRLGTSTLLRPVFFIQFAPHVRGYLKCWRAHYRGINCHCGGSDPSYVENGNLKCTKCHCNWYFFREGVTNNQIISQFCITNTSGWTSFQSS
jgi:type II secretory pathway component PulF